MMNYNRKDNIKNPLLMFNTVGQEVCIIFEAHHSDVSVLGIDKIEQKKRLSKKVINKIDSTLNLNGACFKYLTQFQEDYKKNEEKCRQAYKKESQEFRELKKALPLLNDEFNQGDDLYDDILDFFDKDSYEEIQKDSNNKAALFRKQNNVDVDPMNLKVWLRRGEINFKKLNLPDYDQEKLVSWINREEWKQHINDVAYFENQLPSILSELGVGLILVKFLPKTAYGSVRWINDSPLIEISDRCNDLASCWFTLFHEFGHVILHKNVDIFEGQINEPKSKQSAREREANKFANQCLFNGDRLRKYIFANVREFKENIDIDAILESLSQRFGVQKIFIDYWMRKARVLRNIERYRIRIDFS